MHGPSSALPTPSGSVLCGWISVVTATPCAVASGRDVQGLLLCLFFQKSHRPVEGVAKILDQLLVTLGRLQVSHNVWLRVQGSRCEHVAQCYNYVEVSQASVVRASFQQKPLH